VDQTPEPTNHRSKDKVSGQFVRDEKAPKQRHHRQKGSINKITKDIKNGVITAATNLGRMEMAQAASSDNLNS